MSEWGHPDGTTYVDGVFLEGNRISSVKYNPYRKKSLGNSLKVTS